MQKDIIHYKGGNFIRYPESTSSALRNYYSGRVRKNGVSIKERLHRWVWITEVGEIPKGYHIHHIDGNTLNNDLSNLECILGRKHLSDHYKALPESVKKFKTEVLMKQAQEAAKEWHKSDEGRAWHREHAKTSIFGEERTIICKECDRSFKTTVKISTACFCSRRCKARYGARDFRRRKKSL